MLETHCWYVGGQISECVCMIFKNPTIFPCHLAWAHSDFNLLWRNREMGQIWSCTTIPGVSWVNYCHSSLSIFSGILPIRNSQSDSDEPNEYLHLQRTLAKGSVSQLSCFTGWLVSVGTSPLGSFTHKPPSLQGHLKIQCWEHSNKRLTEAQIEFLQ
jgi:hypothetical protein